QGLFDPSTMTEAGCSGAYQWTTWLDTNDPTVTEGDMEVTKHIQQLFALYMCPVPIAVEARTVFDDAPSSTGDVFKVSITDGFLCLNPYINGFKQKLCTDYKVRYCCPASTIGQTTTTQVTPTRASCGKQSFQPFQQRIVGGIEAAPNSWPWIVSLQQNGGHVCGGTLIDNRHVLTAAHCLDSGRMNTYSVIVGLHNQQDLNTGHTQRVSIQRMFIHEKYGRDQEDNDIAILRLTTPVQLNQYVNIACLPGPDPPVNANVIVAGWGLTTESGSPSRVLRQVTLQIMEPRCSQVYSSYTKERQMCAGTAQYTKDSCQGDSGGPLMYEANGQWYVSGVVSYGHGCAQNGYPGVYTRVTHYISWINSKLNAA
ncbi:unnamed protein product, partial [Didymodactylos carnosus]